MKHFITSRILFLCLFAALGMRMSAAVIDYQDGDLTYKLNTETKTAELAKCSDKALEAIIRENVSYEGVTYSVTALGDYCFQGCAALTSTNIPSSVTNLGERFFENCAALKSIVIPSSVTSLGEACFSNCLALTSVTIPSSVNIMGNDCFYN